MFREDVISHKVHLIRKSPYDNGKTVNVLLTEFSHDGYDFKHYILIYKNTFLNKKYVSLETGKSYRARTIFCKECFSHFRTENALQTHSKVCKSRENQIKVFPEKGQTLKYTDNCNNCKRIFIGY